MEASSSLKTRTSESPMQWAPGTFLVSTCMFACYWLALPRAVQLLTVRNLI